MMLRVSATARPENTEPSCDDDGTMAAVRVRKAPGIPTARVCSDIARISDGMLDARPVARRLMARMKSETRVMSNGVRVDWVLVVSAGEEEAGIVRSSEVVRNGRTKKSTTVDTIACAEYR